MDTRKALAVHDFLLRSVLAGVNTFAWVLILSTLYTSYLAAGLSMGGAIVVSFGRVALLYLLVQVITILLLPDAARFVRNGARRSMWYGVLSLAASYGVLGAWLGHQAGDAALVVFAFLLGFHRVLYRVPYVLEKETTRSHAIGLITEIVVALTPVLFGFLLAYGGVASKMLMWQVGLVLLVAGALSLFLPEVYEGFPWGYHETFLHLLSREHRPFLRRAFWDGIQSGALFFLWPLTIFLIVGSSYMIFGLVLSTSIIASILIHRLLRSHMRSHATGRSLHHSLNYSPLIHSVLAFTIWVVRATVATPLAIVLVDSYGYAHARGHEGVDIASYEQTADASLYLDERTVLKEMGLAMGRTTIVLCAVCVMALWSVGMALLASFIFAGVAAGVSKYVN